MRRRKNKMLATREREEEKLPDETQVALVDASRELLEQLRRKVPVVNLSSLPRVFEWTVVPGPDTLQ